MKNDIDDNISAFLRGEMTKEEESSFLNKLKSDDDLRSQAIAMGYLAKAANEVGEQRDNELKDALMTANEDDARRIAKNATRHAKIVPIRKRVIKIAAMAAVVVLLVIGGYQYYGYRYNVNLATEYQSEFVNNQMFVRSADANENVNKELSTLYANIQSGKDLGATIKRLSLLWELSTSSVYNDYTNYAPLIGWNLAIAELKNNNADEAKVVLQKLISITKPGSSINTKAKELLHQLI